MPKMLSCKAYRELHALLDEIYVEAERMGWTWPKLAAEAGLSHVCVWRLGKFRTLYPRVQTVFMLARAVGMRLKLEKLTKDKTNFRTGPFIPTPDKKAGMHK